MGSLYFTLAEPVEPEHEPHHHYGHGYGHYEPKVPEYNIAPQNIQMGVKIFAEGYTPVSSDTSGLEACAPTTCPNETFSNGDECANSFGNSSNSDGIIVNCECVCNDSNGVYEGLSDA